MSRSRPLRYTLAPALAFVVILLATGDGNGQGQSNPPPLTFRQGQSMYIVAFC